MLVAERHRQIIQILEEKRTIKVAELGQFFSVTEETIRRDLEKLEKEGFLKRSHGGAVINEDKGKKDIPFEQREITNVEEKQKIARMSVRYVKEGDRILLDASTTAWYMAKIIPDISLTVVTNSLKVVAELSKKEKVTAICTGGTLLKNSLSFVGPLAIESLDQYYVNKAFISCKGMHSTRGFTESNEQEALVKRKMLEISDQTYMMLDDSKIDVQAFAKLVKLEVVDHLLINQPLETYILEEIVEHAPKLKILSE